MNTQRTISGYLQIKNQAFPLYKGVNIIGRDIKATVPLKDAILSKFHAIICVGHGDTHISDVQSANGTKVGNVKINPYEIYNIDDKAVITFGNIAGVYYKNANCPPTKQNITIDLTQSPLCDHDALTQVISEHGTQQNNIHDAETQITNIDFKKPRENQGKVQKNNSIDIHDQPTQRSNFHEVETQIVENHFKPDDTKFNNRLTEIHPLIFNNHLAAAGDNKSAVNDSAIFDAATQVVPTGFDVLNEHAIHLDNEVTVLDGHNSISDIETQPNPLKTPPKLSSLPNANDSISDNETQPNEYSPIHCYDDIFANETFRLSLERSISKYDVVVDETLESPSEKMIDDEIADETQATQPVGFKRKEVKPLVPSDDSDDIIKPTLPVTQPIGFKRKSVPPLVSSDDSDDIVMGTQDVKKIEMDIARSELNSAKILVDSDSATDVEDNEDLSKKVKNMNKEKSNTDSDSGTDVDKDLTSENPTKSKKKKLVKRREKATKSDYESDVTEETSSKDRSTLEEETTGQNITNIDSETDVDDNLLIDDKEKEVTNNNGDNSDADTQVAELNLAQNKTPAKNCNDISNVETVKNLNVSDQDPTKKQPDDNISDSETDVEDLNGKAEDSATDVEENLLQDKEQFIEKKVAVNEQNAISQTTQNNHILNDSESDVEEDLLQPVLSSEGNEDTVNCNSEETSKNEEFVSCSSHNSKNMAHNELQDDGSMGPTQIIEPVKSNKSGVEDGETNELAPTQLLTESIIEGDKEPPCLPSKISDLEDDVFLQQTQILVPVKSFKPAVIDTEMNELPPTQLLTESFTDEQNTSNKNNEDDLFLQPTQVLEIPMEVEENDDVFLQPTQILPENKVRVDIYDLATQKLPVSPQDDDVYAIATQKLNHSPNQSLDDSQEGSFRLQMSETEELSLPSKLAVKVIKDESPDIETQLEVNFELDTQKLYIEEETKRPDNPVGLMFSDEETQETQNEGLSIVNIPTTQEKLKDEILSDIENGLQLVPVVAMMDITKSKITLKDIQDASTSKTKKGATKIQKPKVEPIRKSRRNQTTPPNTEASTESINDNDDDEDVETIEDTTQSNKRIEKPKEVSEDVGKQKLRERNAHKDKKIEEKEDTTQQKTRETINRRDKKKEEKEETMECSNDARVKKIEVLEDLERQKPRETIKNKKKEEIESSDFVKPRKPHNTRGKRLDYKQLVSSIGEEEFEEKISNKTEKAEENEVAKPRGRVSKRKGSVSARSKTEIDSDDEEFVISKRQNRTPVKRTLNSRAKEKERAKNAMLSSIEKSSDSSTSSTDRRKRTKVLKICSSEETEMTSSTATSYTEESVATPRSTRTPKRSLPIVTSSEESLATSDATTVSSSAGTSAATTSTATPSKKRRRYEQLNVTVTSDSINVDIKHKVVFTMLSDDAFKTSVKKLGGTVIDTMSCCTVLVTTKISRSLKFLLAIALGKPIVDVTWIDGSVKEGRFLDPWDNLLQDPDMEKKLDINLKTSLNRSRKQKLLMGETILLAVNKNYDVLKDIIESSGAKCVSRIPAKIPNLIVVAYEDERSKYSRYLKQKSLTVVSAEAIFCGVLKQEVNWNKYLLS